MNATNEETTSPTARTIVLELTSTLLHTAVLALDCSSYWGADELYRDEGYCWAPYCEDPEAAACVVATVALHERLEALDSDAPVNAVTFTGEELLTLEAAVGELPDMEEFQTNDIANAETLAALATL